MNHHEVADALAGPERIWVLTCDGKNTGQTIWLFRTEAFARARWKYWVDKDCETIGMSEEYRDDLFKLIDDPEFMFCDVDDREFYTLQQLALES